MRRMSGWRGRRVAAIFVGLVAAAVVGLGLRPVLPGAAEARWSERADVRPEGRLRERPESPLAGAGARRCGRGGPGQLHHHVALQGRPDVDHPQRHPDPASGTTAQILFVDPLGDEFIQLYPPRGPSHGPYLANGSLLPERDTSSAPSIADTLAALGALLNGGGLNQLQTIITNINQALGGHQQQIQHIINDLSFTATALNANKGDVDTALAALATLSGQLAKGDATIANGIDTIGPAISVLSSENQDFQNLLTATNNLSNVADSIVTQSSSSILGTIRQLYAVMNQMVGVESQLGPTLTDLSTFETETKKIAPGNYLQLSLDGTAIVNQTPLLGPNSAKAASTPGTAVSGASGSPGSNSTAQAISGLLGAGLP